MVPIDWSAAEKLRTCFITAMREKQSLKNTIWFDVLVDVAWGKASNRLVQVQSNGHESSITDLSHLKESIFTEPTAFLAPVRVFIAPKIYEHAEIHRKSICAAAEELFYTNKITRDDINELKKQGMSGNLD